MGYWTFVSKFRNLELLQVLIDFIAFCINSMNMIIKNTLDGQFSKQEKTLGEMYFTNLRKH